MKKYLISLLTGILLFLSVIAVFNWLINPFDIFDSPNLEGMNTYKPKLRNRMSKVYIVNRIKPKSIILGSSRSLNIPIEHQGFTQLPVYNLSLESGSGYEMFRMFQHAHAVEPLKTVVIGLDEEFSDKTGLNFEEDRLAVDKLGRQNVNRHVRYLKDSINSLLSIDAIRASISTIKKQSVMSAANFFQLNMQTRVYNSGGHHIMFMNLENAYMGRLDSIRECSLNLVMPDEITIQKRLASLKYFKIMLETAYRDDIQFFIFFSPIHARLQEVLCVKDSGLLIEGYKYTVVELVDSLAKKYNKKPFIVMDFGGANSITTETLPAHGDRTTLMKGYWEGSHYTRDTAIKMLDKLFAADTTTSKKDFGILINKNNIIEHIKRLRQQREQYKQSHKNDILEINKLAIKKVRARIQN